MRYFYITLLASLVALAGACGYDFETEGDRFQCSSDDDCVDGFVCAGHTSLESDDPVTFCVEAKNVEIAVWQETMPAFQSGCDTHVWEFEWDAWMVFSDNETPMMAMPPTQVQNQRQEFIDAGGECVGDVSAFGEVRIMCRVPKGESVANTAAMWVVLYEGSDPLVAQSHRAVAFTSAVVDAATRLAPAPDEIKRHHQFDEYLGTDQARCTAALGRVCPENLVLPGDVTVCTGCNDSGNPCPPHFNCDSTTSTCVPNPEL